MAVSFTQYLYPDGRKTYTEIELSDEVERLAGDIVLAGFRFESELLRTGQASFTVSDDDADYAIMICPNGPEVSATVERLIRYAHHRLMQGTLKEL